jgi:CSLREA domain-containing protein
MTVSGSKPYLLLAALAIAALFAVSAPTAAAQQITYYDFNVPQSASPSQYSYTCSPISTTNPPFCLNDGTGSQANPSFFLDAYPASIDPILTDNPPQSGSFYATQMTPDTVGQDASLWFSVPQNVANGFTSWFALKFTPDTSDAHSTTADGIAFVIQNSPAAANAVIDPGSGCSSIGSGPSVVGGGGGCMGYSGINNSLALEFDTYQNSWDPNNNHIALQDCGAGLPNSADHDTFSISEDGPTRNCSVTLTDSNNNPVSTLITQPLTSANDSENQLAVTLADGNVHQVVVTYSGPLETPANQLQVFLDPAYVSGTHTPVAGSIPVFAGTFDITTALNLATPAGSTTPSNAWVGFTSATGAAFEQNELMAWTFTPHTPVTQQQPLAPPSPTNYQPFNFGSHTYGVQYPQTSNVSGISMTVTATTITPTAFGLLIGGTPFAGSSCQVYEDTGGNCVIYSVSCTVTATGAPTQCPSAGVPDCIGSNASSCINVKTTFDSDNTITPLSPGYLQGDPLYSQISSLIVHAGNASFTCTGECSVTNGQTVSVIGATPATFDGSYTVISASPSTPNVFIATTVVDDGSPTTPGYLTSSNVKNIFTSYKPQNIDGTTKGTTNNFSDFVFTSNTVVPSTGTQLGAATTTPAESQSDLLTATVTASTAQFGAPTGTVTFGDGSVNPLCGGPVTLSPTDATHATATCSYTAPGTTGNVTLSATYNGDPNHAASSNTLPINVTGTVSATIGTSPPGLSFSVNTSPFASNQTETLSIGSDYFLTTTSPQTLSGVPGIEYVFSNWSDGSTSLSTTLIPVSSTLGDTALFNPLYQLSVIAETGGVPDTTGGTATATPGYYAPGTPQPISATINPGYYFKGWFGAQSLTDLGNQGSLNTTVTMNGPEILAADFELIPGYVVTTLTDDSPGDAAYCPGSACTLRDAIMAANVFSNGAGNITFQSGLSGTYALGAVLPGINANGQITITGPGANVISIAGNPSITNSLLTINSGATVAISGLTFTGGNSRAGNGGAINSGGNLTLVADTFSNNTAQQNGGAIFSENASLTVVDSTFSSNQTETGGGGAIASWPAGRLPPGQLTVEYSTFSGNIASTQEYSGPGGAILTYNSTNVANSTFTANSAPSAWGGAIVETGSATLTVTNSVFSGNSAPDYGAALSGATANFNLFYNNLIYGNVEGDCGYCSSNTNAISGNPNLAPLGNYGGSTQTMLPLPSSAAICAGLATLNPNGLTTDQRGLPNSTTYNSTKCTDLGAVQTDYAFSFTTNPPATGAIPGTAVSPAPAVTITESGATLTTGSISVTATDANSDLTTTPATATSTAGVAPFSSLIFTGATTSDKLTATLALNPNNTAINLTTQSTAFSVGNATPTVIWPSASAITYGQPLSASTLSNTGSASFNSNPVPGTFAFTYPTTTPNAGMPSESITFTPSVAGYNPVTSTINVQVNAAPLTVTPNPNPATMTYGGPLPTLTPSYSGFVNGTVTIPTAPTCTTTGITTATVVGPHPGASICSGGTPPANYVFSYAAGSVTVNPATLTVTPNPNPATMTYGGPLPALTPSYSGFVNGTVTIPAAPTCTTTGITTATPVGPHPASSICSGGTAPANYAFSYATGSVTVTPATLIVTPSPNPAAMPFGGPLPTLVPNYSGFVNGTVTIPVAPNCTTTGITTTTAAGTYPNSSTCSGGTAPANYIFSYAKGSVTVNAVPIVTLSPTSINFGTNIYLGAILAQTVTITNTGDATLTFSGDPLIAILSGGNSSEFGTVNLCPKTLAPGKNCTMVVGFVAGPYYGLQTAVLKITDNAAPSPQQVPVSATVIDPVAQFSANTISFGTAKTNSASVTKSITLSNPGGTSLSITGYAFTGADPHDFTETTTCAGTLAAKATPCTISVTFKPTAKGSRTATLVVTDSAQNSPQSITLQGTGN